MKLEFTIPLTPVTKKNHQQIRRNFKTGKPFISQSEQYRQYEREASLFIPKGVTVDFPVNVKCLFYMPTHRRTDLTNLLEAIDDIMVKCGLLEDDNYTVIQSHDGSRVLYSKENPRTEIEITTVDEGIQMEEVVAKMHKDGSITLESAASSIGEKSDVPLSQQN